ncbi:MAG: tetratricopeptide repeat protein [Cyclobacteriaceae bacterium]|nr:tetratricopeptide repeat protein [Cyclobacteriaceae bacterium HetDA_MAG_MS6]
MPNRIISRSTRILFLLLPFFSIKAQEITPDTSDSLRTQVGQWNQQSFRHIYSLPDSALILTERARILAQQIDFTSGIAQSNYIKHIVFSILGDFPKSTQHLLVALRLYESISDSAAIANCYQGFGSIKFRSDQLDTALSFYIKSLNLKRQIGAPVAKVLNNIAAVYDLKNEYERSLEFHEMALGEKLTDPNTTKSSIAYSKNNMASVYFKQKEIDKCLDTANDALEMFRSDNNKHGEIACLQLLSDVYRQELGDYKSALTYAKKGYEIAQQITSVQSMNSLSRALKETYAQQGDFENAYKMSELNVQYKDSISNEENVRKIERLQAKYEIENREKEIDLHKAQIAQKDSELARAVLMQLTALIIIVLTLLLLFFLYRTLRLSKKARKRAELEKRLQLVENQMLRDKVDFKQRELASAALYMTSKNQLIDELSEEVIRFSANEASKNELKKIARMIKENQNIDRDWESFKLHFESVHPHFFSQLQKLYPNLTNNELRHCAYIKINMTNKEVANLLNNTAHGVSMARIRIKKKLNLDPDLDLKQFIDSLEAVPA